MSRAGTLIFLAAQDIEQKVDVSLERLKTLCIAVVDRSVKDGYAKYIFNPVDKRINKESLRTQAKEWLESEDETPFSFIWCLEVLDFDAKTRYELLRNLREDDGLIDVLRCLILRYPSRHNAPFPDKISINEKTATLSTCKRKRTPATKPAKTAAKEGSSWSWHYPNSSTRKKRAKGRIDRKNAKLE